jgi:hypothetical protein
LSLSPASEIVLPEADAAVEELASCVEVAKMFDHPQGRPARRQHRRNQPVGVQAGDDGRRSGSLGVQDNPIPFGAAAGPYV